jgi:hypothetical protein
MIPPAVKKIPQKGEIMSKLTEMAIKKAKPEANDYKMADGGGLYLRVKATGSKCWRQGNGKADHRLLTNVNVQSKPKSLCRASMADTV